MVIYLLVGVLGGGGIGQSWQVEFEKESHLRALRIHWEKVMPPTSTRFMYQQTAITGEIIDQSGNQNIGQITPHTVDSRKRSFSGLLSLVPPRDIERVFGK